jgi:hypothetical protein
LIAGCYDRLIGERLIDTHQMNSVVIRVIFD